MVEPVPQGMQRHQRIDPGRLDAAPAPVRLLVREDPALRLCARALPQRMHRELFVAAQRPVHSPEEPVDGVARRRRSAQPQLVEPGALGDGAHRPVVHQQEERHDGAARPGGEAVDVERRPAGQEHQLRRHDGQLVPGELSEERQPDAGEGPRPAEAAAREDERARPRHVRRVGAIARQLEGEIALDAGGEIARRAGVEGPAPVVALVAAHVLRDAAPDGLVAGAEKMRQHQIFRAHGGVGLQLRPPVAVGVLLAKEPALRALDGEVERLRGESVDGNAHEALRPARAWK